MSMAGEIVAAFLFGLIVGVILLAKSASKFTRVIDSPGQIKTVDYKDRVYKLVEIEELTHPKE